MRPTRIGRWGAALIVFIGLLNFHVPHFLLEPRRYSGPGGSRLEAGLLLNVAGAVIAAFGLLRGRRWGWQLGVLVAAASACLYLLQETVGLPGLPHQWLEPSRLVALLAELTFILLAARALWSPGG